MTGAKVTSNSSSSFQRPRFARWASGACGGSDIGKLVVAGSVIAGSVIAQGIYS
jgi:hypothetical protein